MIFSNTWKGKLDTFTFLSSTFFSLLFIAPCCIVAFAHMLLLLPLILIDYGLSDPVALLFFAPSTHPCQTSSRSWLIFLPDSFISIAPVRFSCSTERQSKWKVEIEMREKGKVCWKWTHWLHYFTNMIIFMTRTMIMTLMTKLYDNLLRINNQPLQLLYLMVMMIMVKMTTTMSENVTKYEK